VEAPFCILFVCAHPNPASCFTDSLYGHGRCGRRVRRCRGWQQRRPEHARRRSAELASLTEYELGGRLQPSRDRGRTCRRTTQDSLSRPSGKGTAVCYPFCFLSRYKSRQALTSLFSLAALDIPKSYADPRPTRHAFTARAAYRTSQAGSMWLLLGCTNTGPRRDRPMDSSRRSCRMYVHISF
jgi:hypothetical protein